MSIIKPGQVPFNTRIAGITDKSDNDVKAITKQGKRAVFSMKAHDLVDRIKREKRRIRREQAQELKTNPVAKY